MMHVSESSKEALVVELSDGTMVAFATDGTCKELVMKGKLKNLRKRWRK